jgi:hypothetical protein
MKTQTTKVGPGRPKKQIQIRKRLSVNMSDFKTAVSLMKLGKSMTKVAGIMRGIFTLNEVVAIRSFAVKNGYLRMKKSTIQGHKTRMAKTKDKVVESNVTLETIKAEEMPLEVSKVSQVSMLANRTLTIDFKGIIMQVEIASIEVKDDTIVVR